MWPHIYIYNIYFFFEICQGERRDDFFFDFFSFVFFCIPFLLILWLLLDDWCRHDVRLLGKRTSKF